jgi:hypothetical protein
MEQFEEWKETNECELMENFITEHYQNEYFDYCLIEYNNINIIEKD